ncbi:hypothetical protein ABZ387_07125 [Streptomyces flaveolus]|uniref:hypothetical protein n=1 Tax=Streptomyces flaveolus TaxID=67297 RepID=UPI0033DE9EF9
MSLNPDPPEGLGAKALVVWNEISGGYDLRVDELRVLEDACREIDLIERLEGELRGAELIVVGSMGQPVANPLVQELRQHRGVLARLLGWLKLPDEEEPAKNNASASARQAAMARWGRGA